MGSIPIVGTIFVKFYKNAPVAELADAPDLGSGTSVWGFKSLQAHHYRTNASILRYWSFFIISRQFKSIRIAAIHQKREILYQSYSPNIECSNIVPLNA